MKWPAAAVACLLAASHATHVSAQGPSGGGGDGGGGGATDGSDSGVGHGAAGGGGGGDGGGIGLKKLLVVRLQTEDIAVYGRQAQTNLQ